GVTAYASKVVVTVALRIHEARVHRGVADGEVRVSRIDRAGVEAEQLPCAAGDDATLGDRAIGRLECALAHDDRREQVGAVDGQVGTGDAGLAGSEAACLGAGGAVAGVDRPFVGVAVLVGTVASVGIGRNARV